MLPMIRYFGDVQKAAHVIMLSGGLGALVVVSHGFFRRGFKQLNHSTYCGSWPILCRIFSILSTNTCPFFKDLQVQRD